MPRTLARRLNIRRSSYLFTIVVLFSLLALAAGPLDLFQPAAQAVVGRGQTNDPARPNAAVIVPGTLAFSASNYKVTEAEAFATITVKRTGGTDGQVIGKIALSDVTTTPPDYRFTLGARDVTFNPGGAGGNNSVDSLALQPDGKVIIGGAFTSYNGDAAAPDCVMRLNADGTPDATFNPGGQGADNYVYAIAVQPDGKIIIGGQFTSYNGDAAATDYLIRLNANGTRDTSFNAGGAGPNSYVSAAALQPDGKIVIGGQFTTYNGDMASPAYVMRLNADGTRDTSFNPGGSGGNLLVITVLVQPDGKILVGGSSSIYNGDPAAPDCVMRLNADGTRDPDFNPGGQGASGSVFEMALQPDGKILIGGTFNTYNGDATAPDRVMRLNADGTRDATFNPSGSGANSASSIDAVKGLSVQPDGKIIVGGEFNGYNDDAAAPDYLIRLNADGTRDTSFNAGGSGPSQPVYALALQPDGKIVIGGIFALYNGDATVPATIMRLVGTPFVTWQAGDAADKVLQLPIVNDAVIEADETLALALTVVSGGATLGTPSSATLTIGRTEQTISVNTHAPASAVYNTSFTIAATSSSGLPVSYTSSGVCTNVGATYTMTAGTGTCTVKVDQAGDNLYYPAAQVTESVTAQKANQTINFSALSDRPFGSADFTVSATASSGLSVSFAASGQCTITGSTVHLTAAGSCTITASQTGNTNYNAALDVARTFQIAKADQTINFSALSDRTFGSADFQLSASATSGLTVSFAAAGKCSLTGNTVHLTGAGSCTITASQAGNANYNAAPDVARTFQVAKATTTTTLATLGNPSAVGQDATFVAIVTYPMGSPTGTVQFKIDGLDFGDPVAIAADGTARLTTNALTQGQHTVTGVYGGAADFNGSSGSVADGGQWVVAFNVALSFKSEGSEPNDLDFLVSMSPAINIPTSVNYTTVDGTAVAPSDYVAKSGTLNFLPGETSKGFKVTINGDTTYEESEEFYIDVSLLNRPPAARGTGIIINDDPTGGVIEFESAAYNVAEGGSLTVKVKRAIWSNLAVEVDYTTDDGSVAGVAVPCASTTGLALDRCDYTKALGTLHFGVGETEKTFTLLVGQDSYVEGAETFQLKLSNPRGNAAIGPKATATVTITDDSPETSGNAIDDTDNFVRQQYLDFLNREPDSSGFQFWRGGITVCGADAGCREVKRIDTSAAFFLSIEFQETGYLVYRMFKSAYGDATSPNVEGTVPVIRLGEFMPDTQRIGEGVVVGANNWEQKLEANKQAYALEFVQRARFLAAFPTSLTAAEFVGKLDENAGGVLTADERAQLIASLGATPSDAAKRAAALRQVAEHALLRQREFNRAFVLMQFFGYLRRDPDAAPDTDFRGWKFWLGKLEEFGGDYRRAEMVKAFLESIEYRQRFGQ